MKYISLFVIALFLLSSCSEDPVSTTADTKPYIEVSPDSLAGNTYTSYDFKARLHNFPYDNVSYTWYFGEGDTIYKNVNSAASWRYDNPGSYTLSVVAYDRFADTIIATKYMPIVIADAKPYVTLTPTTSDTLIRTIITGIPYTLWFEAETNLPNDRAIFHWYFSGGPQDTVSEYFDDMGFHFNTTGLHTVRVDVYDDSGKYWASDTTTINVRIEPVTQEMLSNATQVTVQLYSQRILEDSLDYYRTIIAGVEKGKNQSTHLTVNANTFSGNTLDAIVDPPWHRTHSVQFTGQFNNDLTQLESVHVQAWDSIYHTDTLFAGNTVSFDLKNVSLLSVTKDYVVYLAYDKPLSSYAENISTFKLPTNYHMTYDSYGQVDYTPLTQLQYSYLLQGKNEYAIIVFSRK